MTAHQRAELLHHTVRGCILALYALCMIALVHSGHLHEYVENFIILGVKLTALALVASAGYEAYAVMQIASGSSPVVCDCGHDHHTSDFGALQAIVYGLFIVPPMLGLMFV